MKLIHLSDLHIGKRLYEYSLIDDQKYILNQVIRIVKDEQPSGVIIAGDIYDKSVPSGEAVSLFDEFLTSLAALKVSVYIIAGNHDSPERLSFGSRIIENSNIYIARAYDGTSKEVSVKDEYGECVIHLLPFVKPIVVRQFFGEEEVDSYDKAVRLAIRQMNIDPNKRNILVAHQYVTGAVTCDSEEKNVGGLDNINSDAFDGFDYVALGHIHGPQQIKDNIRYCGTLLKYSFSEVHHKKSVTVVELKEKGNLSITEIPVAPLHEMIEIKGRYEDIIEKKYYADFNLKDFYRITLTNEEDVVNAFGKLKTIYQNAMTLDYDNTRTKNRGVTPGQDTYKRATPLEISQELFAKMNGKEMTKEQIELIKEFIEKIWGEDEE